MGAESVAGSSASSRSSSVKRTRIDKERTDENGEDIWDRRSTLEYGVFGVLFTLSKEKSETRIRIRWVILKIVLDSWQLFATVINPAKQGWTINPDGVAWTVVSVLNFTWLQKLGYQAYVAVLYTMLALLAINVIMCVWVAWCFKEHKFPVVWPIQVLRVFSSVFFQAFDVASLNLLQLGISCRYTGPGPHLHFDLFPVYSCIEQPQLMHLIVSALCLVLFVIIALLLNMAEVEVNPLSRRPHALGHSGAEVAAFGIKVMLTLVDVFIGWPNVAACVYLAFALMLAWQYLRWSPHLVAWVNYLKTGVAVAICYCCVVLLLLVFKPGVNKADEEEWADLMTIVMLAGIGPAFLVGALMSRLMFAYMTKIALKALANPKALPIREVFNGLDEPRDIELAARCCRNPIEPYTPDPEAVDKAHRLIKAGLEVFPGSAIMLILHANFMIDVLGVSQSGGRRMEEARKLNPGIMCRFIMFIRQQQATQNAAGSSVNSTSTMDLLGYVEYQRKQRMVVRLHREALQAMCNFWRALDSHKVSFTSLSKALAKIESSVSQAQAAYRVVLERYGNNPKLVRLYGKFLQTIKNDPWHAAEYVAEAERLEALQDGQDGGPVMPDGTPLSRMDDIDSAVLLVNALGIIQMANRLTHALFGFKRGTLEGKPLSTLLAPQYSRWVTAKLTTFASLSSQVTSEDGAVDGKLPTDDTVVGLHVERLAFPVKLTLSRASGVGEDSTLVAIIEPVPMPKGEASLWVASNGTIAACDPRFISTFGWKATEVNGVSINSMIGFLSGTEGGGAGNDGDVNAIHAEAPSNTIKRLVAVATAARSGDGPGGTPAGKPMVPCTVHHKYSRTPLACEVRMELRETAVDATVYHLVIRLTGKPLTVLVVNRKGNVMHSSSEVSTWLKDGMGIPAGRGHPKSHYQHAHGSGGLVGLGVRVMGRSHQMPAEDGGGATDGVMIASAAEALAGFTLFDFLPVPWKDMHVKLLKETTAVTHPGISPWSCRKPIAESGPSGPTLVFRSAAGKDLLIRVAVETADLANEVVHVIHMAKSSLQQGLGERRVQLRVSPKGCITDVVDGKLKQLFGMEAGQVLGHGLWELLDETPSSTTGVLPGNGPRMVEALVERALNQPGHSWRVHVMQPARCTEAGAISPGIHMTTSRSYQRSVLSATSAVMQIQVEASPDADESDADPNILVDLWPHSSVMGVLDLDPKGKIRAVLEDNLRPAGLLFGLPSKALVGKQLSELVALPMGRVTPADLLSSLSSTKKSSLKPSNKEATAKLGPVHKLQACHVDMLPLGLEVQVLGKPAPDESYIAMIRIPVIPMVPASMALSKPPSDELGGAQTVLRISSTHKLDDTPPEGIGRVGSMVRMGPNLAPNLPSPMPPGRASMTRVASILKAAPSSTALLKLPSPQPPKQPGTPPEAPDAVGGLATRLEGSRLRSDEALQDLLVMVSSQPAAKDGADASGTGGNGTGGSAPCSPPKPPAILDGVPLPSVATPNVGTKSPAELAGRSKLADMVKSVGVAGAPTGSRRPSEAEERPSGPAARRSSGLLKVERTTSDVPSLPGSTETPPLPVYDNKGGKGRWSPPLKQIAGAPPSVDLASADSGSDKHGTDDGSVVKARPAASGAERVRDWVNSKGAFYQNSVVGDAVVRGTGDDGDASGPDGDQSSDAEGLALGGKAGGRKGSGRQLSRLMEGPGPGKLTSGALESPGPGRKGPPGGPVDDDAASDGGQSAVSAAQSATSGTEYTRGKRYRKLVKLMESPQAQQAERRLRIQTLVTVAVLASVHVICFVLTVTSIGAQRDSMLSLARSGKALEDMNRIMTDLRSLDIISANRTLPNLFQYDDHDTFIGRISESATDLKTRFNEILYAHANKGPESPVIDVLYNTHRTVWDENNPDGTDKYTTLTVWDFATRFYTMAMNVEQHHETYLAEGVRFQDTDEGQFLLKSGPYLWNDMRQILDALLFGAVDNAEWIDTLQIAFLVVEGAGISCIAACYLAYLLRSVAVQRYKLYGTFLMIPLGLTRALAAQNVNIMVDDDEEEDMDDEEERERMVATADAEDAAMSAVAGDATPKIKRRATLKVSGDLNIGDGNLDGTGGGGGGRKSSVALLNGVMPDYNEMSRRAGLERQRSSAGAEGLPTSEGCKGCWRVAWWRRCFKGSFRRRRSSIFPTTSAPNGGGATSPAINAAKKRSLKTDSRETYIMLLPFVLWSVLVIVFYSIAVVRMNGVVDVVAAHSVVNLMTGRTYRTVFYGQELANTEEPTLLMEKRKILYDTVKFTRDAWYTLQLGDAAYTAAGSDAEVFPLVKHGVAHSSKTMERLFFESGACHRAPEHLPCYDVEHRFYAISHTGVDSIMQQFMISIVAMSTNTSLVPEGLEDEHYDFVYNVGSKDLLDGIKEIAAEHYNMINNMFEGILILHIILFLLFWVIFLSFLILLLNPLLRKVTIERRRIAELMSQLPLELDVEKLVARALGDPSGAAAAGGGGGAPGASGGMSLADRRISMDEGAGANGYSGGNAMDPETTGKWKAIIRAASVLGGGRSNSSVTMQGKGPIRAA